MDDVVIYGPPMPVTQSMIDGAKAYARASGLPLTDDGWVDWKAVNRSLRADLERGSQTIV